VPRNLSPPYTLLHVQAHHHFHIVHVVVDDLGWGDVGWRADAAGLADGVDTPVGVDPRYNPSQAQH
jgi:hypothetical protein